MSVSVTRPKIIKEWKYGSRQYRAVAVPHGGDGRARIVIEKAHGPDAMGEIAWWPLGDGDKTEALDDLLVTLAVGAGILSVSGSRHLVTADEWGGDAGSRTCP